MDFHFIAQGFPDSSVGKESTCNAGDLGSIPGLGRSPGEGEMLSTPVFWLGEFHGLYSPWGHKESDTTEWLSLSLSQLDKIYLPTSFCYNFFPFPLFFISTHSWQLALCSSQTKFGNSWLWTYLCTTYNHVKASLLAQMVKSLPAMQETPVQFLGREDPLEKG